MVWVCNGVGVLCCAVGEHDGMYRDKRYFKCPNKHGMIVPMETVHILVTTDVSTHTYTHTHTNTHTHTHTHIHTHTNVDNNEYLW